MTFGKKVSVRESHKAYLFWGIVIAFVAASRLSPAGMKRPLAILLMFAVGTWLLYFVIAALRKEKLVVYVGIAHQRTVVKKDKSARDYWIIVLLAALFGLLSLSYAARCMYSYLQ